MDTSLLNRILRTDAVTIKQFGGVYPADKLPTIVRHRPRIYIANTDPSSEPGKHWVSLYFPRNGPSEFFDSLGHSPRYYGWRFERALLNEGRGYLFNGLRIQQEGTITCGQFCLYYAFHRCRGESMDKIVKRFHRHNLRLNEDIVELYFRDF